MNLGKQGRKNSQIGQQEREADEFAINDDVVIQDDKSKKWTDKGKISGERKADDNSIQSFKITLENGGKCIRNKRFIKHNISAASNEDKVGDDPAGKEGPSKI